MRTQAGQTGAGNEAGKGIEGDVSIDDHIPALSDASTGEEISQALAMLSACAAVAARAASHVG